MKMRDLIEKLDAITEARAEVQQCHRAIEHGGSNVTMAIKYRSLGYAQDRLDELLDEEIGFISDLV